MIKPMIILLRLWVDELDRDVLGSRTMWETCERWCGELSVLVAILVPIVFIQKLMEPQGNFMNLVIPSNQYMSSSYM